MQAQHYLNLQVDNDLYFKADYYYSSGIFVDYGYQLPLKDTTALVQKNATWKLGQEIYTPSKRYSTNTAEYDYPYSGYLYLQYGQEYRHKINRGYQWALQMGWSGAASQAQRFQNLYHDLVLNLPNLAWVAPQPQLLHAALSGSYYWAEKVFPWLLATNRVYAELGTHRTRAGVHFGIVLGKHALVPFNQFTLSQQSKGWGIYLGTRQEFRSHDFPLEGSAFGHPSAFVVPSNAYRNILEGGITLHNAHWRLLSSIHAASKDTPRQRKDRHLYLNISIARFF